MHHEIDVVHAQKQVYCHKVWSALIVMWLYDVTMATVIITLKCYVNIKLLANHFFVLLLSFFSLATHFCQLKVCQKYEASS